ncbi:hypothetical protein MED121_08246 [Marinomonas sp. MED121]|nr:hypothetical protein MED121_08246 [Marinomonas sp. MED121]
MMKMSVKTKRVNKMFSDKAVDNQPKRIMR